jgi:hypothetical protein
VSATSDDVIAYAAWRPRLNRLLNLLWKSRRNRPAISEKEVDPPETSPPSDSVIYGDHLIESEIIFMSTMWTGM